MRYVGIWALGIIFISSAWAHCDFANCDSFTLRAGIGLHTTTVLTNNHSSQQMIGGTFTSSFSFRDEDFEYGLSSLMMSGITSRENEQKIQSSKVYGRYWFRAISFGPVVRYYVPWKSKWEFFGSLNPMYEITTLSPHNKKKIRVEGGEFKRENGLRYLGRGIMFGLGVLKNTPEKTSRIFYELTYKIIRPYKLIVMKDSSWQDTIVESKEEISQKVTEHTLAINVGMIFF